MNILIIGNGGREHTLAWKVAQSPQVNNVFVAPGNAGTACEAKVSNVAIDMLDNSALVQFAGDNLIALTIVGPETPLSHGIVDAFTQAGLACFGPSQAAAQLESSKTFSKQFMQRHHIPTASFAHFSDLNAAKNYVKSHALPLVIKADGLAAGKGVVIAQTENEALIALDNILQQNAFGIAGNKVVIEEFLSGEECSFIVVTDGKNIVPLATSQDHKARDDGDRGPNTGGMGAYSPAPIVTPALQARILQEVIQPTIQGMAAEDHPYVGFLYAGLMIDKTGNPKVLEFNCRLGDPETEVILPRLQTDLVALCQATLCGELASMRLQWDARVALGVVLAAKGYPETYAKGFVLPTLPILNNSQQKIFHAGTDLQNGELIANRGRLLCVTALADTVKQAQQQAYAIIDTIDCQQLHYRKDIGYRAV